MLCGHVNYKKFVRRHQLVNTSLYVYIYVIKKISKNRMSIFFND